MSLREKLAVGALGLATLLSSGETQGIQMEAVPSIYFDSSMDDVGGSRVKRFYSQEEMSQIALDRYREGIDKGTIRGLVGGVCILSGVASIIVTARLTYLDSENR